MNDDPQLESFLRQFRPLPPPPLGRRAPSRRMWVSAAIAASAAAAVLTLLITRTAPPPVPAAAALQPTVGSLKSALRAGMEDDVLEEWNARTLPDPAREGGALRVLSDLRGDH